MNADVHVSPVRACVFNSRETGEREVGACPLTGQSSAALRLSASSAPPSWQSPGPAVDRNNSASREARATEREVFDQSQKAQRDDSPSLAERKASLEAAALRRSSSPRQFVSRFSTMEEAKAGAEVKVGGEGSNGSVSSGGGAAKSVIKISSNNVTIISTGRNAAQPPKVTTTPLRGTPDRSLGGAHVSMRKKDTDFISALTNKFQPNGAPANIPRPAPVASSAGYRGSNSQGAASSGSRSDASWSRQPEGTSGATSVPVGGERQRVAETGAPPPPPLVNGHAEGPSPARTNGHSGEGQSSVDPPTPPAPPAPSRPVSELPAMRKADASYTPR